MNGQMENPNIDVSQEQEIDLMELIKRMWENRMLILKITGVCFVLGLLIAVFSSKEYTAGCDFVPQTSNSGSSSRMSSLAALAGINMNQMEDVKALSPYVYENIRLVDTSLKQKMPKIKAILPEASFLIFLDCRELGYETQEQLVDFFVNKARLGLNDGAMFGKEGTGFMRLNVATPRSIVAEAMKRLEDAYLGEGF